MVKQQVKKIRVLLAVALSLPVGAAHAEGWFSRLITGDTSSETVSASGVYAAACGGCHIAYRPHLLPAVSWERLMSATDSHFGETLALSEKEHATIRDYLLDNGAGRTADPLATRIMAEQGGAAWPLRITEMVFFKKRHQQDAVPAEQREALGKCESCHARAGQGDYTVTASGQP